MLESSTIGNLLVIVLGRDAVVFIGGSNYHANRSEDVHQDDCPVAMTESIQRRLVSMTCLNCEEQSQVQAQVLWS